MTKKPSLHLPVARKRPRPVHVLEDYTTPTGEVVKAWKDKHGTWRLESGGYAPGSSGRLSGSQQVAVRARAKLMSRQSTTQAVASLLSSERLAWSQSQCFVCNSPSRPLVERWRAEGHSFRVISKRLAERGEVVSDVSVRRHLLNHVDTAGMVLERIAEDSVAVKEKVDSDTSDLERLGAMIERLSRLEKHLSQLIEDCAVTGKAPPMAVAHSYQTVVQGLRQSISLRDDLLGGQPKDALDEIVALLHASEDTQGVPGKVSTPKTHKDTRTSSEKKGAEEDSLPAAEAV